MKRAFFLVALVVGLPLVGACDEKTCEETLSCTKEPGAGTKCAGSPKEDPACISDAVGVFVSAQGKEDGSGAKADPVKSVAAALQKRGERKTVFVCEGNYVGPLELSSADQGVDIFGGLDCATWAYSGAKPVFAGVMGLRTNGITEATTIADVHFRADDAQGDGESSIAATLVQSSGLTFRRVGFTAGAGKKGADGAPGVTGVHDKGPDGENANGAVAGPQKVCTCSANGQTLGTTSGGGGGSPSNGSGADGAPSISPAMPAAHTGKGGSGGATCTEGQGATGSDGSAGKDGSSSDRSGTLANATWVGSRGEDGMSGAVAQGGGGGAGHGSGGGGGGACGGCPATAGSGGQGGGSAIVLLSIESAVTLDTCAFTGSTGAVGGQGAPSLPGSSGGIGASGSTGGCGAGDGGKGGDGGAGAGGAGGISVGILYKGAKPTATNATFNLHDAGAGGKGGKPGVNDGPPGIAAEFYEAK